MRVLLPALLAFSPLIAAEPTPVPMPPPVPMPAAQPAPPTPGMGRLPPAGPQAEMMKEMREVQIRYQAIKEKADADPELMKVRTVYLEAQKAYRAKLEETLDKDPGYAEVKAKREEIRAKMMPPMVAPRPEGAFHRPGQDPEHPGFTHIPVPAPPSSTAPVPPVAPEAPVSAPAK